MVKRKHWYNYLWLWSIVYFSLGFFNILFAWLGLIDMFLPMLFAILGGNKHFCNYYCGRGQLFSLLGIKRKLSRNKLAPSFLASSIFRYGFLVFFMTMFGNMCFQTYLVFSGVKELSQSITLLWSFKLPWSWAYPASSSIPAWVGQFSFGLYSVMLTSLIIGLVVMYVFKARTWCTFCPMGTMTQGICKLKNLPEEK